MLLEILNKSWRQQPTKQQLYGHLPPITKTIQIRRTRRVGHCWKSCNEFISDVLLWTTSLGREKAGRPARTYIQYLCADTGCSLEAMDNSEGWRERIREICVGGVTWYIYICVCVCGCVCGWLYIYIWKKIGINPTVEKYFKKAIKNTKYSDSGFMYCWNICER